MGDGRVGEALEVAEANQAALGAGVNLVQGSWYEALPADVRGWVDVIVSNPPYVSEAEMRELGPEVRDWEPAGALCAGPDGLEDVAAVIRGAGVAGAAGEAAGGDGAAPDPAGGAAARRRVRRRRDPQGPRGARAGAGGAVVRPDLVPVDETGEAVKLAVAALTAGQVVALPTDTVYGTALPGDPDHTAKLFALKGRGHDVPVAVLCSDLEQALALADRERMPAGTPSPHRRAAVAGAADPRATPESGARVCARPARGDDRGALPRP